MAWSAATSQSPHNDSTPSSPPSQPLTPSTDATPPPPAAAPAASARHMIQEHLLPTTMSCRDAFDSAFYCNSLGGAFMHLYRYGTVRSCSEHWDKFWFCMRTRTYGDAARQAAIQDYYRDVERRKYGRPGASSEDIWESRDGLVDKGTAFRRQGEEWQGSDEEWRSAVLEMRKTMRERAQKSV
ncbi:hypothetical protein K3495_g11280 [Podosphaera aphanis]|nr:hypothetical protein K3495_g11280 [Podosphaera aphanis]